MKKRLISLLLALSMMLTFLPAGAVSAFAEEPIDPSSKGELLNGGDIIEKSGTYQRNHDQYGRSCGDQCNRKCDSRLSGE